MGVIFSESRALPRELRAMGHYRGFGMTAPNMNTESAVADIFRSLTVGAVDFFGGSSSESKEAAANAAIQQAQMQVQLGYEEGQTKRTLIYAGAAIAGVFLLAMALRPSVKVKNVSGYRRRKRSRR
jgi:hypothetical protein